ncbi:MAG: HEAT repeat domain-containing protein [Methanomicrobiales archaeon]|nr:HEAT repeat domain-containing protein [Methanomicrobiales archaeon]
MEKKIEELIHRLKQSRSLSEIKDACACSGGDTEVIHQLTEVLGSDEMSTRWKAAVALTDMGSPAVDDLIQCLSDRKSCVRSSAAWVLGNIGDNRAVQFLLRNMEDPSADVRKETAEALGKLRVRTPNILMRNGTPLA